MNIKKLLIGNFFLTFIWFFCKVIYYLCTVKQQERHKQNRVLFPDGRLHLIKYGADSLTNGANQ